MAVDENGNQITGEMVDYQPTEMTICNNPANGRRALVRMSADTASQAAELRAQGVAVDDPEPGWLQSLDQRLTQAISKAFEPLTKIFNPKGIPDMSEQASGTPAPSALSETDLAKIDQMITEKIAGAKSEIETQIAEHRGRIDALESAVPALANNATPPASAETPPAEAEADKSVPTSPLEALVLKQAEQIQQLTGLVQTSLNARSAGHQQPSGAESAPTQKSVWAGSHLAATLASIPN